MDKRAGFNIGGQHYETAGGQSFRQLLQARIAEAKAGEGDAKGAREWAEAAALGEPEYQAHL